MSLKKINPMSWGRRLAKEAIRQGKRIPKNTKFKGQDRSRFAKMAQQFKKASN